MPDVPLPAASTTTDNVAASTTFLAPARASRVARVSVAVLGAWLAFWLWCGRYHMLDDALIHLRYAEQLRSSGLLTYNGGTANFGTSSLLYVVLLAACRPWVSGPLLPKLLSCGVYVGLWLVIGVWRARAANRVTFGAWSLLWFALSGPLAVRWLTDGMETGLTLVAAIAVAASLHRLGSAQSVSWRQVAVACVVCAWAVVLRIELCLLVAVIGCAALRLAGVRGVRTPIALRFGPAFAAAACSVLGVWLWTGHVLPDTAIAKAHGGAFDSDSGRAVLTTVAASGSLGIGLCVAWLVSWWLAAVHERAERPSTSAWLRPTLCANALFPVLVVLIVARGQAVQGVRYLAWAWVASVTWNVLTLQACARRSSPVSGPVVGMALRLGAALIWLLWAAESSTTWHILAGRSETFLHMSESDWTGFSGARAVAADIGFLGYFSRAEVCDLNGLINGRAFARLSSEQRARHCAEWRPVVAFLTESQRRLLTPYLDVAGWTQCGHVDFTNFASLDRHALLLHPQSELRCPAGFSAHPEP